MKTKKIVKCEICSGIFSKNLKKRPSYTVKSENEKRCTDCEFIEKLIKDKCFICGDEFKNSINYYIYFGNCCRACMLRVDIEMKGSKAEARKIYEERIYSNFLKRHNLKNSPESFGKFKKERELTLKKRKEKFLKSIKIKKGK